MNRFTDFLTQQRITLGPLGISDYHLACYIAFLYQEPSIDSSNTISTYLNMGVRRYHELHHMPFTPIQFRFDARQALAGARRLLGPLSGNRRKLPMTVEILLRCYVGVDLRLPCVTVVGGQRPPCLSRASSALSTLPINLPGAPLPSCLPA